MAIILSHRYDGILASVVTVPAIVTYYCIRGILSIPSVTAFPITVSFFITLLLTTCYVDSSCHKSIIALVHINPKYSTSHTIY